MSSAAIVPDETPAPLSVLSREDHSTFLGFLERRVGDRGLAEDILQDVRWKEK